MKTLTLMGNLLLSLHVTFEQDSSSHSSAETISSVSSSERGSRWPSVLFPIPTFSFDVELKLRESNAQFEKNHNHLQLTRDVKHDILEKLASSMYGYKAYPSDEEIAMVAEALVGKYPCLKEVGSETGWKNSLEFKMGNYRSKMSRAGCPEITVNAGKRSRMNPDSESSHSNIKRAKPAEVNFLPNFPQGENPSTLEQFRQKLVDEMKKAEKNFVLYKKDDADNIIPAATDRSEHMPTSERPH